LWRGIRFRQVGSAWLYVGNALLGLVLCIVTLGFYFPWFQVRLLRYETDNLRFGSQKFRFTGRGGEMFGRFVACWAILVVLVGGAVGTLATAAILSIAAGPTELDPLGIRGIAVVALLYLTALLAFSVVGTWYQSKFWRFRAAHTHCEGLRFAMPDVTTGRLMRLLLGNWALVLITFGLLSPLATQRTMRFWSRHLQLEGMLDLERIAQAEAGPRSGEGLAGFFDIDLG
jgi:uncharacterized membrane protein YjgN (DUF898 family)